MSSILKALKKLDAEKSARRPDTLKIDAEILRGETPTRISSLGIFLVAMLLFICGGVATYLYMKPKANQVASNRDVLPSVIPTERIIPDAIVPASRMTNAGVRPATPAKAGPAPSAATGLHSNQPRDAGKGLRSSVKIQPDRVVHQPAATAGQAAAPVKPAQTQGGRPGPPAPPLLRVNGIAFQDGVDSVAMVNGVQVIKGSTIEGVRVVDIQRDRVLFSLGGNNFEIALGRSNR